MASNQEHETAQSGCLNINVNKNIDNSNKPKSISKKKQLQQLHDAYDIFNVEDLKPLVKDLVSKLNGKIPGINRASRELLVLLHDHCVRVEKGNLEKAQKAAEKKASEPSPPKKRKRSAKADKSDKSEKSEDVTEEKKDQ